VRLSYDSAFRMRRIFHSWPALCGICLFFFATLSFLAGCGKVRSWYAPKESDNPHSVTIDWTASTSSVAGYNVYRSSPPGAPVKLTFGIVSGTKYVDRTVEGGLTYSYFVTAVDSNGRESKPSASITVEVPTTVTPPDKQ
jgi:hypothetical protein